MPAKWFKCPDAEQIEIDRCLKPDGCRMPRRCATLPYLRLVGFDRKWQGVSPSSAGNGPRILFLKASTSYTINPEDRVWASLGTGTHGKLSIHEYSNNVLTEEKLSDKIMQGISDVLEIDENKRGWYILYDYKTWGSYKLMKALGISVEKEEETVLDDNEKPVILKSGPNKGKPKTKTNTRIVKELAMADLKAEGLQLNRYRIFFEEKGFPISRMEIQAIPRDGGTWMAKSRGIDRNLYMIGIKRMENKAVVEFYKNLSDQVNKSFRTGYIRLCDNWESWERRRCDDYCEVMEACKAMSKKKGENWGII